MQKSLVFMILFIGLLIAAPLSAQEQTRPNTLTKPKSTLLLFGNRPIRSNDQPLKKTYCIPKLELFGLLKKKISVALEFPIDPKTSFTLNASWQKLNQSESQRVPGTYTHRYTQIDVETTTWILFVPIISNKSYTAPGPFEDWGDFLPTAAFGIEPAIRAYLGKKQSGNRFYIEPGVILLFLSGVNKYDHDVFLNKTTNSTYDGTSTYTTTTNTEYQQTRKVTGPEKRTVGGIACDFGFHADAGRRFVFDLGLNMNILGTNDWFGLKKFALAPQIHVGYRI